MDYGTGVPLSKYTTFKIGGPARFFVSVNNREELQESLTVARERSLDILALGGGSNLLVSDEGFSGLVIKISNKGREIISETEERVFLEISAGEILDEVIAWTIQKGWWGMENLSLIPGSFGAVAIQNVGAYGQQASEIIESVDTIEVESGKRRVFAARECNFGYRRSIFNSEHKGKYIVWKIKISLLKKGRPVLRYPDLEKYFSVRAQGAVSLADIRQAVISVRRAKLPDPAVLGNAGSFFKNPSVSSAELTAIRNKIGDNFDAQILSTFDEKMALMNTTGREPFKIPAGYLVEICGLKGRRSGGARVYEKQGLVIVNESGSATADDVLDLYRLIGQIVLEKCGVALTHEPEFVGFK